MIQKLEQLTEAHTEKMQEVKQFWLDYIFSCKNSIDKEKSKIGIDWVYQLANKKSPVVIYVESPMACQFAVLYLKEFVKQCPQYFKKASVWDSVWASVGDSVWASVGASVWDSVWASVGASVRASVRDSVGAKFQPFSAYGNIGDYGWVSFYDFFTQINVINHEKFNTFKEIILSGIYDTIQLEGFCIVSNLPDKIQRNNQGRLHCSSDCAIHFRDGYELYYWNGVNVVERWIKSPETITKEEILKETNAEKRRVLREILGAFKYYDIISNGKGLTLVDEDTDNQGHLMRLYETSIKDTMVNKTVQFLECVCPSTMRIYNIYPPSQKCKNVWEAKANTFQKTAQNFQPILET